MQSLDPATASAWARPPGAAGRTPRRRAAAALCASLLALASGPASAADGAAPGALAANDAPDWLPASWVVGATLDGRTITAVEAHAEFVRVHFAKGGFEIVRCRDAADPWCAHGLRIQPLPEMEGSDAFFRARLTELERHDDASGHDLHRTRELGTRIRLPAEVERLAGAPEVGWAVLALLLTLALALRLTRPGGQAAAARRWVWLALIVTAALPVLGRTVFEPDRIAISEMSLVHEGDEAHLVDLWIAAYRFDEPAWLLTPAHRGLLGRVAANRLLHGLAVVLLFGWLRALAGVAAPRSRLGALWICALYAFSAPMWVTASGETWTPALAVALLLGGVGLAAASREDLPRGWRLAGVALMPLLASLVERRAEVWVLAAWVVVVGLCRVRWTAEARAAAAARVVARLSALVAATRGPARWAAPLGLGLFVVLGVLQALREERGGFRPLVGRGVHAAAEALGLAPPPALKIEAALAVLPTDWSFVWLPVDLSIAFPIAWSVGVLVAARVIVRRRWDWLWLLVAVLSLFKVYRVAGHGHAYEMTRYLTGLAVPLALLVGVGALELERWITRDAAAPLRRRLALCALAIATLVDGRYRSGMHVYGNWLQWHPLRMTEQSDAQVMGLALARWPRCLLVTTWPTSVDHNSRVTAEGVVAFGAEWNSPQRLYPAPGERGPPLEALAEAAAALDPPPRCMLALGALDCQLVGAAGCEVLADRDDAALFEERVRHRPYRHPHWGHVARDEVVFWVKPLARRWRTPALRDKMTIPERAEVAREGVRFTEARKPGGAAATVGAEESK